ncbi:uncharacterized protein SPSK_07200 [Sporothrix schenckii 1099-18]|uniref:Glucose-methanol-choline oxidoreductase N-terminal domain-containing protein n=1 Tax=Sporothrix schenckii 1099-18 TaxID=1397361 RepID=A0A0F2MDD4_SPOSC|nr:uncharacterized protein SPSK_07200 [Sporothrix schenckii 1099-18]KJR87698.1 hypothetical protein SPSK_07200 [Sporothrix schenckii 1099-18]
MRGALFSLAATALIVGGASAGRMLDGSIAVDRAASDNVTYDYIVIGSGPGGGPLACDLARAGYSTLLIEAGDDQGDNPVYSELANFNTAGNDPDSRWDFWVKHSDDPVREMAFAHYTYRTTNGSFYVGTEPPAGATPLGIQYPRAGTLGGCAMHNGGVCSLPADDDWNIVVNMTGDTSWEAPKMRKYLVKVEKNQYLPTGTEGHGFDGWLATAVQPTRWARDIALPATRVLKQMAALTGQNASDVANLVDKDILGDYPHKDTLSSFYNMAQHQDKGGKRSSPNNYIKATLKDPKNYPLMVRLNTLATRVLFQQPHAGNATSRVEGTGVGAGAALPVARGVEIMSGASLYLADPRHTNANVTKKGPVSKVWARREVIVSGGAFNSPQILKLSGVGPAAELSKLSIPIVKDLPGVGERLADNYEGSLLALGQQPVGGGFITLLFKTPNADGPNRNIFTWCGAFSFEGFWPGFPTDYGPNEYECAMVLINPHSQAGTVKLASADPQVPPDINLNFFLNNGTEDLQHLADAAKLLRTAWQAAGDPVLPFNEKHPCPGTGAGNCTDEAQRALLKTQAYSHHASSSCAIGSDTDPLAVLDSKFRVRGVQGLRVVDASAFPRVPGAFPVLPTIMLSAKAAEEILADAKK